ncbi:recF/RecN/SMC N terminal domain protein [Neorickettsia helminthoeca str. Oregon]|uniref:DNA replication and repair protein RecF n=1 Tax=Neorickettsia helminthoeca str. Oregon TaxID=1286528 RepID=X5H3L3_9RICK|nr:DNA recombination protein RecF [Neorickettsia helminthoeca]AHX11146.1 recF/RecN/SMC N terminal domain protein [Neorickettsia helminthoeca str. Oregon]
MKPYITEILLKDFRNHSFYKTKFNSKHVLFFGRNGVGKTSILEAVSKLSPGLGIRSAKNSEIISIGATSWEASFKFVSDNHLSEIGTGYCSNRRILKLNKQPIIGFGDILSLVRVMWFTPQMGNVFITDKSVRRKFFDRLVALSDPQHLDNLVTYEKLRSDRLRILSTQPSKRWLDVIERKIATLCVNISASRESFIDLLEGHSFSEHFASPRVKLICTVANDIMTVSTDKQVHVEDISRILRDSRAKDSITGKMDFGIHRADFLVIHGRNANTAKSCSTGEQKSLILAILLAASELVDIMLLDDIFSHLDQRNLELFLEEVMQKDCQFFFSDLESNKILRFQDRVHAVAL